MDFEFRDWTLLFLSQPLLPLDSRLIMSKLRQRVTQLTKDERLFLSHRSDALSDQFIRLQSDADLLFNGGEAIIIKDDPLPNHIPIELILGVVDDYHKRNKSIDTIAKERNITEFHVLKALCSYVTYRKLIVAGRVIDLVMELSPLQSTRPPYRAWT